VVRLKANAITAAEFSPFGDLVEFNGIGARLVNDGHALRSDVSARLGGEGGAPVLSVYRAEHRSLPFALESLEQHPHSSQTFVSITGQRFLIVVAPSRQDGQPDFAGVRAFICSAGQGINYKPGIWHAPITALDGDGDFVMLMWERGTPEDCIFHPFPVETIVAA
jgi:ureidoglycolate lyase